MFETGIRVALVALTIIVTFGLAGGGTVLFVVLIRRKTRTTPTRLILNLYFVGLYMVLGLANLKVFYLIFKTSLVNHLIDGDLVEHLRRAF